MSAVVCCQASGAAALVMGAEDSLHTQHPQTGGGRNAPREIMWKHLVQEEPGRSCTPCIFVSITVLFWAKLNLFTHFALLCVLYMLFSLCCCVTSPVSLLFCTCFLCFVIFSDASELLCIQYLVFLCKTSVFCIPLRKPFTVVLNPQVLGDAMGGCVTRTNLLLFPQRF